MFGPYSSVSKTKRQPNKKALLPENERHRRLIGEELQNANHRKRIAIIVLVCFVGLLATVFATYVVFALRHSDNFLELVFQNDSKRNVATVEIVLGDLQTVTRNLPQGQSRRIILDAEPPEIVKAQMSVRVRFEDGIELNQQSDRPRNGEKITVFIENGRLSFLLRRAAVL